MSESTSPARPRSRFIRVPLAALRFARRRPFAALTVVGVVVALMFAGDIVLHEIAFNRNLEAARTEVERGHNAAAAARLAACRAVKPMHPEVLLLSAAVARRSGAWDDADELLAMHSREHGDNDALAFERLLLRAAQGDLDASAPRLLSIILSDPTKARSAREALIAGFLQRFRWIEAERHLADWLAVSPEDTAALLLRGKYLEQRQVIPDAINDFTRVVALDAEHDEARLRVANLLLQQRRSEELLAHAAVLNRRMPHLPEVRILWVKALALQGRTDESRAALEQCLADFPDFAPALAQRGVAALQSGDDATAERFLGRAAQLAPGDFTTRSQYAAVLTRLGKHEEAERERESLKKLEEDHDRIAKLVGGPLQSRPNDPSVPHEIATIALRSGQAAEGRRWLLVALAIDPSHGPSHQVLANFYQASGNPALAAKHRAMARQHLKTP
jgi:tetratricopeptide (TPR) repeat protein